METQYHSRHYQDWNITTEEYWNDPELRKAVQNVFMQFPRPQYTIERRIETELYHRAAAGGLKEQYSLILAAHRDRARMLKDFARFKAENTGDPS